MGTVAPSNRESADIVLALDPGEGPTSRMAAAATRALVELAAGDDNATALVVDP
jgi:hypothetical protein